MLGQPCATHCPKRSRSPRGRARANEAEADLTHDLPPTLSGSCRSRPSPSTLRDGSDILRDGSGGVRTERVIVQAKHWRSKSVNAAAVSETATAGELWSPPLVRGIVIATSGRFTADAGSWAEGHNAEGAVPYIDLWPDSRLETLLAQRRTSLPRTASGEAVGPRCGPLSSGAAEELMGRGRRGPMCLLPPCIPRRAFWTPRFPVWAATDRGPSSTVRSAPGLQSCARSADGACTPSCRRCGSGSSATIPVGPTPAPSHTKRWTTTCSS
ncbi:restriction endonuclease [Streptomyces sp. NRRL S-378]|uniref:restriction endonuclease n=1 Tax=Streptomyces sp. NRRL S-378 TaxID=1463904 RepID=UPI003B637DB7